MLKTEEIGNVEEENMEGAYAQVLDAIKAVMHSDVASMQLYVPGKKALKLLAWKGIDPDSARSWEWVSVTQSYSCALALNGRKRIFIPDIEAPDSPVRAEDQQAYRQLGVRSAYSIPLFSRSAEIVGMMSIHWRKVHKPAEQEFGLLEVIARHAADLLELSVVYGEPQTWTADQTRLVQEVAERTWTIVERVRVEKALRESDDLLNGQKEAFQAAMRGLPLTESLRVLVDTAVAHTRSEARAAFYLVPPGGEGLYHIVGMPEDYANDVNGFVVGPESLACGLAMHTGQPVITPDVDDDPSWKPLLGLARKYNFRGCWSFPVRTEGGPVVGTFGLYFTEVHHPTPRELELAGVLTHAASIIISRDREQQERARAEQILRDSETQLRTLVRLRDEFIGNASHELRTPLTSIMVYAEMLEEHFKEEAGTPYTEMMRKLSLQVKRLHVLIGDMLDTTRVAEGKLILTITKFDLDELIHEKAEDLQRVTRKHRILTEPGAGVEIEADEERIGQVITNLLSNAIKYSPQGGDIVMVSEVAGDFVEVSITDHGMGIPAAALDKVFERFYRVDSKEVRTFPGMGIGLAICQGIIDMHGGRIAVESEEGKGSTFTFIIPIRHPL